MTEAMMLLRHGTKFDLPVSAIAATAKADIERFIRFKQEDARECNDLTIGTYEGEIRRYAFHPKHIRKARDAIDLLLIAAQVPAVAEKTTVRNRAMIYQNPDLLIDAAETLI